MNETPRNVMKGRPEPHAAEFISDQAIESAALAGAAAIQRLVAERNGLRNRLGVQDRELAALRAVNEDLRRSLIAIHQHYVDLAKRVVGQLEQFDGSIREVIQEAHNGSAHREDAPPPASLVQRLAGTNAPAANASRPAPDKT
jgi:hypothetical protein